MRPRRIQMVALGGTVLAAAVIGAWLWLAPIEDDPPVPSCADLAAALPASAGETWTVRRAEPSRTVIRSTVSCLFAVASSDHRFSGEVTVLLVGDTDPDRLRREVTDGPCYGGPLAGGPATDRYLASKQCVEVINGQARVGLFATSGARFVHVVAAFGSPVAASDDTVGYARDTAHGTAEQGLHLTAGD